MSWEYFIVVEEDVWYLVYDGTFVGWGVCFVVLSFGHVDEFIFESGNSGSVTVTAFTQRLIARNSPSAPDFVTRYPLTQNPEFKSLPQILEQVMNNIS